MQEDNKKVNATLIFRGGYNQYDDGTCITIKNQYFKNSISNFESQSSFGATGVIEIWKIDNVNKKG